MKNFMDRIPCGMYRITSDNSIEKLKDPKSAATKFAEKQENISYSEMIPGSSDDGVSLHSKYFLCHVFSNFLCYKLSTN